MYAIEPGFMHKWGKTTAAPNDKTHACAHGLGLNFIAILEDFSTSGAPGVYIGGILMRRAAEGECLDVPSVES